MDKYIYFVVLLFLVGLVFMTGYCSDLKVKKSHEITNATVLRVEGLNKSPGSVFVTYFYFVDGVKFQTREGFPCGRDKINRISDLIYRNSLVKVAYEKTNPKNCRILLNRANYIYYKIEIPSQIEPLLDSLEKVCFEK